MTKEEQCKLKIQLQIDDINDFQRVCYLLDSPSFLNEIKKSRKKLKLNRLIPRENLKQWLIEDLKKYNITIETKRFVIRKGFIMSYFGETLVEKETDGVIESLRLPLQFFWPVVNSALLTGIVTDADISSKSLEVVISIPGEVEKIEEPCVCFYITPNTTIGDVEEAFFSDSVRNFLETIKKHQISQSHPTDTANNVKRDRNLYWRKMQGESWNSLASDAQISRDGVRSAVKSYTDKVMGM